MASDTSQDVMTMLEQVAGDGRSVIVELRDGRHFADGVCEVGREYGEDFVVFHANNRVLVRDIVRAEQPTTSQDDGGEGTDGVFAPLASATAAA